MEIEKEIELLKQRNQRVEADKAWERSTFRTTTIAFLIYITATVVFYTINISRPFLNAVIPPIGYILSVQSLPSIKRWWIKNYFKK